MSVSYAIMAHPRRRQYVDGLLAELGDVPVAWAVRPFAKRNYREPVWRTCRAAMLLHDGSDHHVVLQDDVILTDGFRDRVEALCETLGDRLGMLFYRHKRTWRSVIPMARQGRDFVVRGRLLGPAVIYPTHLIADLIATCDPMDRSLGSDDRIKVWARERGIDTYIPIPSLVDHRVGPSLVGHPEKRVAWRVA